MTFSAQAAQAYAMIFAESGQGAIATYSPLAGGSSTITVVVRYDTDDRMNEMSYRVTDKPVSIWILKSDVATPVKGDRIALSGGDAYQIAAIDSQDEFLTVAKTFRVRS